MGRAVPEKAKRVSNSLQLGAFQKRSQRVHFMQSIISKKWNLPTARKTRNAHSTFAWCGLPSLSDPKSCYWHILPVILNRDRNTNNDVECQLPAHSDMPLPTTYPGRYVERTPDRRRERPDRWGLFRDAGRRHSRTHLHQDGTPAPVAACVAKPVRRIDRNSNRRPGQVFGFGDAGHFVHDPVAKRLDRRFVLARSPGTR